jgi:hypothetical protein
MGRKYWYPTEGYRKEEEERVESAGEGERGEKC